MLRRHWSPGEHFGIYAPTGTGKSHLWSRCLAPLWSHTLTLDLKVEDPDNRKHATALGAKRIRNYPTPDVGRFWGGDPFPDRHYWLEPLEAERVPEFTKAMRDVFYNYRRAIRVVYSDEFVEQVANEPDGLGMWDWSNRFFRLARGRGITFGGGTQSPFYMGKGGSAFIRQPRWHYIGRTQDDQSLDRYKGISGLPKQVIYEVIPNLGKHEWLLRSADLDLTITFTPPKNPRILRPREPERPQSFIGQVGRWLTDPIGGRIAA